MKKLGVVILILGVLDLLGGCARKESADPSGGGSSRFENEASEIFIATSRIGITESQDEYIISAGTDTIRTELPGRAVVRSISGGREFWIHSYAIFPSQLEGVRKLLVSTRVGADGSFRLVVPKSSLSDGATLLLQVSPSSDGSAQGSSSLTSSVVMQDGAFVAAGNYSPSPSPQASPTPGSSTGGLSFPFGSPVVLPFEFKPDPSQLPFNAICVVEIRRGDENLSNGNLTLSSSQDGVWRGTYEILMLRPGDYVGIAHCGMNAVSTVPFNVQLPPPPTLVVKFKGMAGIERQNYYPGDTVELHSEITTAMLTVPTQCKVKIGGEPETTATLVMAGSTYGLFPQQAWKFVVSYSIPFTNAGASIAIRVSCTDEFGREVQANPLLQVEKFPPLVVELTPRTNPAPIAVSTIEATVTVKNIVPSSLSNLKCRFEVNGTPVAEELRFGAAGPDPGEELITRTKSVAIPAQVISGITEVSAFCSIQAPGGGEALTPEVKASALVDAGADDWKIEITNAGCHVRQLATGILICGKDSASCTMSVPGSQTAVLMDVQPDAKGQIVSITTPNGSQKNGLVTISRLPGDSQKLITQCGNSTLFHLTVRGLGKVRIADYTPESVAAPTYCESPRWDGEVTCTYSMKENGILSGTPEAGKGAFFDGFQGDLSSNSIKGMFFVEAEPMGGEKRVFANFLKVTVSSSVEVKGVGEVSGEFVSEGVVEGPFTCRGTEENGTKSCPFELIPGQNLHLKAVSTDGAKYRLAGWEGGELVRLLDSPTYTVFFSPQISPVVAHFAPNGWTLRVKPAEGCHVSSAGIDCRPGATAEDCREFLPLFGPVWVSVEAEEHYQVWRWVDPPACEGRTDSNCLVLPSSFAEIVVVEAECLRKSHYTVTSEGPGVVIARAAGVEKTCSQKSPCDFWLGFKETLSLSAVGPTFEKFRTQEQGSISYQFTPEMTVGMRAGAETTITGIFRESDSIGRCGTELATVLSQTQDVVSPLRECLQRTNDCGYCLALHPDQCLGKPSAAPGAEVTLPHQINSCAQDHYVAPTADNKGCQCASKKKATVDLQIDGEGDVLVEGSDSPALRCHKECRFTVDVGKSVLLKTESGKIANFHAAGAAAKDASSFSFSIPETEDITQPVYAFAEFISPWEVQVKIEGRGRVTGPNAIDCLSDGILQTGICRATITDSGRATLQALSHPGSPSIRFHKWEVNNARHCQNQGAYGVPAVPSCEVVSYIDPDVPVVARFSRSTYEVDLKLREGFNDSQGTWVGTDWQSTANVTEPQKIAGTCTQPASGRDYALFKIEVTTKTPASIDSSPHLRLFQLDQVEFDPADMQSAKPGGNVPADLAITIKNGASWSQAQAVPANLGTIPGDKSIPKFYYWDIPLPAGTYDGSQQTWVVEGLIRALADGLQEVSPEPVKLVAVVVDLNAADQSIQSSAVVNITDRSPDTTKTDDALRMAFNAYQTLLKTDADTDAKKAARCRLFNEIASQLGTVYESDEVLVNPLRYADEPVGGTELVLSHGEAMKLAQKTSALYKASGHTCTVALPAFTPSDANSCEYRARVIFLVIFGAAVPDVDTLVDMLKSLDVMLSLLAEQGRYRECIELFELNRAAVMSAPPSSPNRRSILGKIASCYSLLIDEALNHGDPPDPYWAQQRDELAAAAGIPSP